MGSNDIEALDQATIKEWRCGQHKSSKHTVFTGYRQETDQRTAKLFQLSLEKELKKLIPESHCCVFLDTLCLRGGEDWKNFFLHALQQSRVVVYLLSESSFEIMKGKLQNDKIDNVLLEIEEGLKLRVLQKIVIIPIFVGSYSLGVKTLSKFVPFNYFSGESFKHVVSNKNANDTFQELFKIQGYDMDPDNIVPTVNQVVNVIKEQCPDLIHSNWLKKMLFAVIFFIVISIVVSIIIIEVKSSNQNNEINPLSSTEKPSPTPSLIDVLYRYKPTLTAYHDVILVVGGSYVDSSSQIALDALGKDPVVVSDSTSSVLAFNISEKSWSQVKTTISSSVPVPPRSGAGVVAQVVGENLWVFGGDNNQNDQHIYSLGPLNRLRNGNSLQWNRFTAPSDIVNTRAANVVWQDEIYIIGGQGGPLQFTNQTWIFNTSSKVWRKGFQLVNSRTSFTTTISPNGTIFGFGGWQNALQIVSNTTLFGKIGSTPKELNFTSSPSS
ncbi:hypothetical protein HK096_002718, partial [Nowakowskiella sp. JEL0078]